jgi:hypothetical protein
MTRSLKLAALIGALSIVTAVVVMAATGDPGDQAAPVHKRVCMLADVGDGVTLDLEGLKDGESRTTRSGDAEIVATRKGNAIEVVSVDRDGTRRTLVNAPLGRDGVESCRIVVRTSGGDEGAPVVINGGDSGDHTVIVKKLCVRSPGEGETELKVDAEVLDHDCGIGAADPLVTFRCKDDGALVSFPKAREPQIAPACPVCGKTMEKAKPRLVVVHTTVTEDPDES